MTTIATLKEFTREDVLPLDLDDGTRITCVEIAGGKASTEGKPDHLLLRFTDPDHGDQTVRYYSEKAVPAASDVAEMKTTNAHLQRELATANQTIRNLLDTPDDLEARALAVVQATVIDLLPQMDGLDRRVATLNPLCVYLATKSTLRWEEKLKDGIDSIERRITLMIQTMERVALPERKPPATKPKKPPAKRKKTVKAMKPYTLGDMQRDRAAKKRR